MAATKCAKNSGHYPYVFLWPGTLTSGEWAEIDWEAKEWRIPGPKMKNSKPHIVPLARQVLELLGNLRRFTGEGRNLFPSWGKEGHLTTNALLKAIHAAGYLFGEFTADGNRTMTVKEATFALAPTLERMKKRGFDITELVEKLHEKGMWVSIGTLHLNISLVEIKIR